MKPEQALQVLINAVRVANTKGAYSLEDSEIISQAVRVFTPKKTEESVIEYKATPGIVKKK